MTRVLCCCLITLGCTRGTSAPPPSAPAVSGVAPGEKGSWEVGQRRLKGVRPVDNPTPPSEAWSEPQLSDAKPRHLGGVSLEGTPPPRCVGKPLPDEAQYQLALSALAAEPAREGAFDVELLPSGCARLIEWRKGGDVQRWELRRLVEGEWKRTIQWDFDAGVKRPSTVHRFALSVPLDRFGEWEKDEVHRKRYLLASREEVFTHYRGEHALFAEQGGAPQRISSNVPTASCRLDGSNHCDNLEQERWWKFSGNPY